ncbi:MAG: HlyC/CorC family transporter [Bacteroidetes bacterium]|uniref:HlyC/CorC family transporter n=1 Tax=Candidatus Cryptobacteroides intestinigallinarum TaxID=2840767 RepID=A0A9D9HKZ0_9BACT|nr:HlyC/CorC family transporter [Candidatus Cryptobacteroides intestinigallinarum]
MSEIFIILFLILLNGIFSMSEMAVISARKSNLQTDANKGSKAAKTALNLSSDPDKFLSAVQIGITLIGILTGIFSGKAIADSFAALLVRAGMAPGLAGALAQGLIVILVTYLSIVFGELVPKRIALSSSERVAKIVAGPMKVISVIASPFVWVLAKSTSFVINLLGVKSQESKVTEEEIKSIIQEGTDEGEVSPVEQDIVERVFALGDLKVNTIMTLRGDIVWLDKDMDEAEIRRTIEENLFEAYPVTDGDLDHVIGVLSLKDFVLNVGKKGFNLESMIHEPVYFHETMSVYAVLEQMKKKRISRALVCDEYGFCSGIITLKDIMEALVGIVNDDHQKEPDIIARHDNDGWFVDGQCSMYDFRMYFDIDDNDTDSEYTTVGGLILDELQHVPISGEKATWRDFSFEVVDMDGARIDKVIVKRIPKPAPEPEAEPAKSKEKE